MTESTRRTVVVLLLAGVVAGVSTRALAQTGTVAGTVLARGSGGAVTDAAVLVEGTSLAAASSGIGRFVLSGVPAGSATLIVQAPGFSDARLSGVAVRPGEVTSISVELDISSNFLDRIQVTATKSAVSLGDIAAQADIVDRSTIDKRGDQTLTQAISHVPGAVVATQLGIFDSVALRGLPRGDPEFTNTLVLIDGVPQTLSNNGARVVAMPINDASSIEIVRGPNSAVYGRTAIGGSVNILTASPTPVHEVGVDLTAGAFGTAKGVVNVSGPAGAWGGYYASVAKEHTGGYFTNLTTDDFVTGHTAGFGKLTFQPTARTFGSVSVNRVVSNNSTPTNEPVVDGRLLHDIDPRFNRLSNFNIPGRNYQQRESRVTAHLTHAVTPWARLVETFGYRDVQHAFVDDGDFIGSPYDLANHTLAMYPFSQELNETILYEEIRLEVAPSALPFKQSFTVGGSYEHNSGTLDSDFIYNDEDLFGFYIDYLNPAIPPRSEWQHDTGSRVYHLGVTGLFGLYSIQPTGRLILSAGGRYDRLDLDNARNGGGQIDASFEAFSPKVSATVKLLGTGSNGVEPTLNAYGAYSQSFLPPRRPSSLVPGDVPLNLEPEDINNYEAGLKANLAGGRVALEATVFRMLEQGVVLTTRQGPFFLPTNAGEQTYKGLETGVSVQVSPRVSAYLNTSFYRNRFGDFVIESEDGDTVLTGNRLPIAPDTVTNWGLALAPRPDFTALVDVQHVGQVMTDRANTFALEAYTLVNAAITWTRGPVRITLSGHNLFDQEYYWNGSEESADPGRPRQVLVSTSWTFR